MTTRVILASLFLAAVVVAQPEQPAPAKPPGRFGQFMQKVLDEAQKNPTYRNLAEEKEKDKDRNERDRRDKGKPRARPGRRR